MIRSEVLLLALTLAGSSISAAQSHNHDSLSEQQLGDGAFPHLVYAYCPEDIRARCCPTAFVRFRHRRLCLPGGSRSRSPLRNGILGHCKYVSQAGRTGKNQLEHGWETISKAEKLPAKTAPERGYISALVGFYEDPDSPAEKRDEKYLKHMEKVYKDFPDDLEAAAF